MIEKTGKLFDQRDFSHGKEALKPVKPKAKDAVKTAMKNHINKGTSTDNDGSAVIGRLEKIRSSLGVTK